MQQQLQTLFETTSATGAAIGAEAANEARDADQNLLADAPAPNLTVYTEAHTDTPQRDALRLCFCIRAGPRTEDTASWIRYPACANRSAHRRGETPPDTPPDEPAVRPAAPLDSDHDMAKPTTWFNPLEHPPFTAEHHDPAGAPAGLRVLGISSRSDEPPDRSPRRSRPTTAACATSCRGARAAGAGSRP